jgi:chromosome segregation ATPase
VNRAEAQHAIQVRQIRDLESPVDALAITHKEQFASVCRKIEGLRRAIKDLPQQSAEMKGEIVSEQSAEVGTLKNANTKLEEILVGRIEELKQVKDDMANIQRDVAKLKEDILALTTKQDAPLKLGLRFPPLLKRVPGFQVPGSLNSSQGSAVGTSTIAGSLN